MMRAGIFGLVMLAACGSTGQSNALRSPSLDYQAPAPTTADGDTVGADRVGPGEKSHQGVSSVAPAPGWSVDKDGAAYDPKQRVGGSVDPVPANGSSNK